MTQVLSTMLLTTVLIAAVIIDLRTQRIPNLLCLAAVMAGFFVQAHGAGFDGLQSGAAGLLTGLVVLSPLYLSGGMGAGDVKLMAAVGVFLGASATFAAGIVTLVAGSAIAGGVVLWQRIQFWASAHGLAPVPNDASAVRLLATQFPYSAAIAVGVIFVQSPLIQLVRTAVA